MEHHRTLLKSCCVSTSFKGVAILLVWTALLHSVPYYGFITLAVSFNVVEYDTNTKLLVATAIISIARAITYLLYPVAGLLGELYWSRYKVMIVGNVIAVVGAIIAVPSVLYLLNDLLARDYSREIVLLVGSSVGIILHQFGLGLFEANAIQFGVDQLQFASNDDVSKFVNWYYWTLTVLEVIPGAYFIEYYSVLIPTSLICIFTSLFCCCCQCHFIKEPVGHVNPVKHIARVSQYARQHTVPVFRSAFTYGEGPPSRLDLAKNRYGGPYTTEEVEDVKSFGRIVLVLLSQFGVLLVDEMSLFGAGLVIYCFNHCYGWIIGADTAGGNPVGYVVFVVMVPIYMIIIRPCFQRYIPNMLKRMGISLVLVVISLSIYIPTDYTVHMRINYTASGLNNIDLHEQTIALGIVAQVTAALAYLINFLTALEFILAQAPRNMQGLLIGVWYAYQGVAVLIKLATIFMFNNNQYNYLPTMIKLPLAVISFIMYVIVSRWYHYRERNEPSDINEQRIIEEYTERQLLNKSCTDYNSLQTESIFQK